MKEDQLDETHDIGFSSIYKGHNRRTWANYWSPSLTAFICAVTSAMVVTYPVITLARPGMTPIVIWDRSCELNLPEKHIVCKRSGETSESFSLFGRKFLLSCPSLTLSIEPMR